MNKNEQYKRIISFFSSLILILFLSGVFIYIWYEYYSDAIVLPFYRRGNWVVIFIYMILTLLFFKAYGGLKMGYLKRSDMLYSQSISRKRFYEGHSYDIYDGGRPYNHFRLDFL